MGCGCSSSKGQGYDTAAPGTSSPAEPLSPERTDTFVKLFGDKLLGKDGELSIQTALAGTEAVAIYFSAHWCPPCKAFTPELAKSYKQALRSKGMEIIFVSSDRSQKDFQSYYKEMPWLAVPYSNRDIHQALNKKFKVQGIPSLVILDKDGQVITKDGRSKIASDPQGQAFPWEPKPFAEVLGSSFRRGDAMVGKEALAGKTLGIYFSAHWCPPCRGFTPTLAKHYKAYKEKGLPFEIVFSTGDRDEASFESYYKEMAADGGDWLAMPWSASAQRGELDSLFEVSGIPCLVIVDENGNVINKNARGDVSSDPIGDSFPWAPPAVGSLESPEGINNTASVCVFMEGLDSEQQKNIMVEMDQVAKKYIDAGRVEGEDPAYRFFAAKSDGGVVAKVRQLCSLPKDAQAQPVMLLLDLDDDGAFYASDESIISATVIETFIKSYEGKQVARQEVSK